MANQLELTVAADDRGGACWQVVIDGTVHQNRDPGPLRELIERHRARQPVTSLINRWAQLPHIEGLCNCFGSIGCNRCSDAADNDAADLSEF